MKKIISKFWTSLSWSKDRRRSYICIPSGAQTHILAHTKVELWARPSNAFLCRKPFLKLSKAFQSLVRLKIQSLLYYNIWLDYTFYYRFLNFCWLFFSLKCKHWKACDNLLCSTMLSFDFVLLERTVNQELQKWQNWPKGVWVLCPPPIPGCPEYPPNSSSSPPSPPCHHHPHYSPTNPPQSPSTSEVW